jgi:hypothetical protein
LSIVYLSSSVTAANAIAHSGEQGSGGKVVPALLRLNPPQVTITRAGAVGPY